MPARREYIRESKRPARLYTLLATTLILAGILGYQAYDSARSHRQTAENALRQYSQLAGWRYSEHAEFVLDKSFGSAILRLGKHYRVPLPDLWEPRVLLQKIVAPDCCGVVAKPLYAFRVSTLDGELSTAGMPPPKDLQLRMRDTVMVDALESFDPDNDYYRLLFGGPELKWLAAIYTVKANNEGEAFIYGMVVEPDAFGQMLRLVPPVEPLLPPSLTLGKANEEFLGVSVLSPAGKRTAVLNGKMPHTYAVKTSLTAPFDDLWIEVAVKPEMAEALVIGGLPASRLPIVAGAFVLTAAMILIAVRQLRRENELARERASFAMGVSHELRTPLTQIRMFLESVLLGRTTSSEQSREYLEIAHEESKRLSNLVDNVLRFSRVERGSARINPVYLDLGAEARRIADSYLPRTKGGSAKIQLALGEPLPVSADPDALRAIVGNLLDNAVKYGAREQTITVGAERRDTRARLFVMDEGPGIPKEERDRIWEPYRRLDRDLESAVAGTGIGLAIVREFVHLHQGQVWVEDSASGGAKFVVELPLAESRVGESTYVPMNAATEA
jgi:signal transduction histidine kinase